MAEAEPGRLYRVTLPSLCAGVVVRDGRVVRAAPVLGWSVGTPLAVLAQWVRRKGGALEGTERDG